MALAIPKLVHPVGSSQSSQFFANPCPAWTAAYPVYTPDSSKLPAAWTDALNAAVAKGLIPNTPPSAILSPNTNPVYPGDSKPTNDDVCSGTYKCRIPGDVWDAPMSHIGTGFDDGPTSVCLPSRFPFPKLIIH